MPRRTASGKRPDVVLYVNGIAMGVLELKRSTVSVAEGIRQNLDNQKKEFIQPFFSTMQWLMAGNDSEGLRYATIETPEKHWLRWVEDVGAGLKPARTTGLKPARTTGLESARTTGLESARTTGLESARTTGLKPAPTFIEELKNLPPGFRAKGDIHVFVDECHRTQSGDLHRAMKAILPNALFIGFTGTPLLKADKARSIEVFGRYIHTYKFDQAVREGVVLDLRYEARDIDQSITSQDKIDVWFEANTKGLNDLARAQLKKKWGTMQQVLSCQSRLEKIVADILLDMLIKPRLMDGHGNAMLEAGSIYEACKFYELFAKTGLKGKCAIVTSYAPSVADTKGETTGEGETDSLVKYKVYTQMLADWFGEPVEKAINKVEKFEQEVKKQFIEQPGQMKLLIVVDKLLTGFDAPPATYLYIDKKMRDHGLFQAICRVNRLDGDDKEYGYIIDYKDLFQSLEGAVADYTSGALDGFDKADVAGLLENRLEKAREDLEEAREAVNALCEPVSPPRDSAAYLHYFCAQSVGNNAGNAEQLKNNEPKRLKLYKFVATLVRAYAAIANELTEAGYTPEEIEQIKAEVDHASKVRDEVKLASGDYIDLKAYEPAMRFMIDTYIRAEESEKISTFDDMGLIQLIVERGPDAVDALPKGIRKNEEAVAETIENNVRRLIINESPVDPAYYEKMSKLLDALIDLRRKGVVSYKEYLDQIAALTRDAAQPGGGPGGYPAVLKTGAQRALYNNLDEDADLALAVDAAIQSSRMDGWRDNSMKTKRVRNAVKGVLTAEQARASYGCEIDNLADRIVELSRHQDEY